MYTVLLPLGVNPTAVNKYIISLSYHITSVTFFSPLCYIETVQFSEISILTKQTIRCHNPKYHKPSLLWTATIAQSVHWRDSRLKRHLNQFWLWTKGDFLFSKTSNRSWGPSCLPFNEHRGLYFWKTAGTWCWPTYLHVVGWFRIRGATPPFLTCLNGIVLN